jgi:hypothetical protein
LGEEEVAWLGMEGGFGGAGREEGYVEGAMGWVGSVGGLGEGMVA